MVKHLYIREKITNQNNNNSRVALLNFDSSVLMFSGMSPLEWKRDTSLCFIFPRFDCVGFTMLCHLTLALQLVKEIDAKSKHRWSMEENSFCLSETLHHFPSQNATTQSDRLPPRLCLDTVAFVNPKTTTGSKLRWIIFC